MELDTGNGKRTKTKNLIRKHTCNNCIEFLSLGAKRRINYHCAFFEARPEDNTCQFWTGEEGYKEAFKKMSKYYGENSK